MQLYIVRHGIAIDREDPKCPPDPERFLTPEGVDKAKQVAKGIAEIGAVPDLMLSSPYFRAFQTAEIFANTLEYSKQNPKIRAAAARRGTPPTLPRTFQRQAGILRLYLWPCSPPRRRPSHRPRRQTSHYLAEKGRRCPSRTDPSGPS